jgi:hypothetical protein
MQEALADTLEVVQEIMQAGPNTFHRVAVHTCTVWVTTSILAHTMVDRPMIIVGLGEMAAIPAPSPATSSSHAPHMILVESGSAILPRCLSQGTQKSAMGGYKQGHCVLWADEAQGQ